MKRNLITLWALLLGGLVLSHGPQVVAAPLANGISRVSLSSAAVQGNGDSFAPDISRSGGYVVFQSEADNLISGDSNGASDVFVHERPGGITRRLSEPASGAEPDGAAGRPVISGDSFWVAFESSAGNLVPGDGNFATDIYVSNRSGTYLRRVSVASDGSEGNGLSFQPAISNNGRFVAFVSMATNLFPGAPGFGWQVYLHDRNPDLDALYDEPGQILTVPVSVNDAGQFANGLSGGFTMGRVAVSDNGMIIAFASEASNLAPGDTNGVADVFVHNRDLDNNGIPDEPGNISTTRVSVTTLGDEGDGASQDPQLSADGRFVLFTTQATNLVSGDSNGVMDVMLHDRPFATTRRVSVGSGGVQGAGPASGHDIDSSGRYISFNANQGPLTTPGCDPILDCVYRHDRVSGDTVLISRDMDGSPSSSHAFETAIASSGQEIAFVGTDSFYVNNDNNSAYDVFVFDNDTLPPEASGYIDLPVAQLPGGGYVLPWGSSADLTVPLRLTQSYTQTVMLTASITAPNGGVTTETATFLPGVVTASITLINPFPQVNSDYVIRVESGRATTDQPDEVTVTIVPQSATGPLTHCPACLANLLLGTVELESFFFCGASAARSRNAGWLSTLYGVRDNLLVTTPAGRYYAALYAGNANELSTILLDEPLLLWQGWEAIRSWDPALTALVNGSGGSIVITQAQVDQLDGVLSTVADHASPALAALIQSERAALDLPSFVGLTMDAAWSAVNDRPVSETYLPQTGGP